MHYQLLFAFYFYISVKFWTTSLPVYSIKFFGSCHLSSFALFIHSSFESEKRFMSLQIELFLLIYLRSGYSDNVLSPYSNGYEFKLRQGKVKYRSFIPDTKLLIYFKIIWWQWPVFNTSNWKYALPTYVPSYLCTFLPMPLPTYVPSYLCTYLWNGGAYLPMKQLEFIYLVSTVQWTVLDHTVSTKWPTHIDEKFNMLVLTGFGPFGDLWPLQN